MTRSKNNAGEIFEKLIAVLTGTADEATREELRKQCDDLESHLHRLIKGLQHPAHDLRRAVTGKPPMTS